jgi:diguanylate cyclase (GGDEF)-like protein
LDNRFLVILSGIIFLISAFLISFLPNSTIFLAIKILLIITAFVFFYFYQDRFVFNQSEYSSEDEDKDLMDNITEIVDEPLQIESDRDVEKIFDSFLATISPLIKTTLVADSVVLFLMNFSKKKFYIRYKVTDFEDQFTRESFVELDQGLPAVVFKNKSSLIENHLPDSENLIPYYSHKVPPAKSFLGVPVYYKQQVIGVLCVDSSAEESFSNDDLKIITMFSQLIKLQLVSSNKLYEYETENWIAKILYDFSKEVLQFQSSAELWKFLGEFLRKNFGADRIIISERMGKTTGKISFINQGTPALKVGQEFPLNEGIIGWVFRKDQSLMVDDFAEKENYVPRFYMHESPEMQYRSLLSVPVSRDENVRAAISLECFKSNQFKNQTKKILETMAYQIASFLEKIEVVEKISEQNIIDTGTGLGNIKALQRELDKEIKRAKEFDKCFSIILFKLNHHKKDSSNSVHDKLVSEFLSFSLPEFPKSSNIFRVEQNSIAIILAEKLLQEVVPIVQGICKKVSEKNIWVDGLIEDFNINCGLVQYPEMGDNSTELIEKAQLAMTKAELKGPNISELYEDSDSTQQ